MKVLIATDGSKFSKKAVEKLSNLIVLGGNTELKIISVVEPFTPSPSDAFGVAVEYYREAEKSLSESAGKAVKDAKKTIQDDLGDSTAIISTEVIKGSFPKHAIIEEARAWEADLIVVGSHGYGFWDRMLLGSVSDAILHHAPCSVLVVRIEDESEND